MLSASCVLKSETTSRQEKRAEEVRLVFAYPNSRSECHSNSRTAAAAAAANEKYSTNNPSGKSHHPINPIHPTTRDGGGIKWFRKCNLHIFFFTNSTVSPLMWLSATYREDAILWRCCFRMNWIVVCGGVVASLRVGPDQMSFILWLEGED